MPFDIYSEAGADEKFATQAQVDAAISEIEPSDIGAAPAPTGTPDGTKFYRDDGTWATPAGGGGGVTDHGALTGLGDDDHTQYALADGSRGAFAAPLGPDDNYVTDAEKIVLGNTSGMNTGDQDLSGLVPTSRTVNGKALSGSITLNAADVGASTFSGDYDDLTSKPTLGTAAATASTDYATAAQGALADSALQVASAQPINAQTGTTYTLVAGDAGKLVTLDNTGAITLNAPGSVFTAGQQVDVIVLNTGMATVVGTSGATANGTPSLVSRARYSAFTVKWLSATSAVVVGDLA